MATMPSASLVSNSSSNVTPNPNVTSMETTSDTPLNQALQIVEKKVRNLEKRKGKLDGYRADYERGKVLNDDQKSAIAKYDEVMQTLEFARELTTQFKTLALDEDRNRKKVVKREQLERTKADVARLATVLGYQDIVLAFRTKAKVRNDFTSGEEGAIKLTKEQLGWIEDFGKLIEARGNSNEADKVLSTVAGHLASLVDGKAKKVGKTTYKDLLAVLQNVKNSGYFNKPQAIEEEAAGPKKDTGKKRTNKVNGTKNEKVDQVPEKAVVEDGIANVEDLEAAAPPAVEKVEAATVEKVEDAKVEPQPAPQQPPQPPQPQQQPQQQQQQQPPEQQQPPQQQQQPVVPMPTGVATTMTADSTIFPPPPNMSQFVPSTTSNINFLQESQIDMESPHMDPAVVVVHQTPPPATTAMMPTNPVTFNNVNPIFITPTTLAAIQRHELQQQQFNAHHFQQHQMPPQQQPQQAKPAPGFNVTNHPPQHPPSKPAPAVQQPEPKPEQPTQIASQAPVASHEQVEAPVTGEDPTKPPGYATIAAGKPNEVQPLQPMTMPPVTDTMASIDDWNDETAANDDGHGNSNGGRRDNYRGRGRGTRGSNNYRGNFRGGYRGGRGGENGDRGGYRGRGNGSRGGMRKDGERGGYNKDFKPNNRGGSSYENRGRGGRGANRGGPTNGYREHDV